jgi:hypothetical protein
MSSTGRGAARSCRSRELGRRPSPKMPKREPQRRHAILTREGWDSQLHALRGSRVPRAPHFTASRPKQLGKEIHTRMNEETESIVRCKIFIPAINIRPYWPRNSVPRSREDAGRGGVDGGVECGLAAPVHLDPWYVCGDRVLGTAMRGDEAYWGVRWGPRRFGREQGCSEVKCVFEFGKVARREYVEGDLLLESGRCRFLTHQVLGICVLLRCFVPK